MSYNSLVFGNSKIEKIVSCEVNDDITEIFIEDNGIVRSEFKPNKFWILAPIKLDPDFLLLEGNLYYKYVKLYSDRETYLEDRKKYYKRDIYSINDEKEAAMVMYGFTYYKGMKVNDVSVLAFDIESRGLTFDNDSEVYIISNTFRNNGIILRKMFSLDEYQSQSEMIDSWCNWVREVNPSVMVGHNIFSYDIPYLDHVANLTGTTLKLGRDGSSLKINTYESKFRKDGSQSYNYKRSFIYGRELVDTMFLSYKYDIGRKYTNYGLKTIIKEEKLEIANRQFYDAGKIAENWNDVNERKKIKAYAEQDGDDALALYDLMVPSLFYWTQSIPKSFQSICYSATGSQINSFLVRSYLQDSHSIPKTTDSTAFTGAISFGVPGVYKNVFKVDVASLYPSIILEYGIYDKYKDPKGNFLQMVRYFTEERLKNKKLAKQTGERYYKDLEQSQKIGINSAYGMLAAQVNFNSPYNAANVTKKGREILEKAIVWATSKDLNYWLEKGDTGSDEDDADE